MRDMDGDEPLRAYVDARFTDHRRVHESEHRALDAATRSNDKRLDGMNEFRDALRDAQASYVTRELLGEVVKERNVQIAALNSRVSDLVANSTRTAITAGVAAGVLGIIGGVIVGTIIR